MSKRIKVQIIKLLFIRHRVRSYLRVPGSAGFSGGRQSFATRPDQSANEFWQHLPWFQSMCEWNFGSIYPGFPVTKEGGHPLGEVFERTAVIRDSAESMCERNFGSIYPGVPVRRRETTRSARCSRGRQSFATRPNQCMDENFGSICLGFPVTKEGYHPLGEVFERTAVIRDSAG